MKLAWKNILHERTRFLVTTMGVAFATTLMIFQGSLLFGFLRAASKLIETTDSDIWITARGVACFDFPGPIRTESAGVGARRSRCGKRQSHGDRICRIP